MNALINVVVPVFGVVFTGYLAGRLGVLGPDSAAALNRFVFYFALPPALFIFMARAPVEQIFNWPFIGAFVGGALSTLLIGLVVGRIWLRHDVATLSIAGLTVAQANVVYMGLPLLLMAYGQNGALPTIIATLCVTMLFICGTIAVLEGTRASGPSTFRVAAQLAGTVLRNPLVISPLLGILFAMTALPLPKAASNYLDLMAAAVGPAALFALGLSLIERKLMGNMGEVIWLTALKLIANPILTLALVTYVFAMDPLWSSAAVILSAMPTGANAYVVAQQYGVHVETVSSAIIISTGMSVITISLLLIWLGVG
jgi:malonate transporter